LSSISVSHFAITLSSYNKQKGALINKLMNLKLLALLLAAVAGSAMAFQGTLNAALGKAVGLLEATLIVMFIGFFTALLSLYPLGLGKGNIFKLAAAPWYSFLGGLLIVIITYAVVASIPRVGVANATTAIVAAQVITAVFIDHFGLFGMQAIPFSWWKIIGLVLLAVGTRFMLMH
jgi:bacterial/archaeal transporter family-2 protein